MPDKVLDLGFLPAVFLDLVTQNKKGEEGKLEEPGMAAVPLQC